MFGWLKSKPTSGGFTHSRHYEDMLRKTDGQKRRIALLNTDVSDPFITLTYKWNDNLSDTEADDLDTRVRAFIACAIYDVAKEAGLSCSRGPLYGIRPSWAIENESIPYSVVDAGYDVSETICYVVIGPCMMAPLPQSKIIMEQLEKGFKSCFSSITV